MNTWDNLKRSFKIAILTVLCIILAFSTGLSYVLSYGATSEPEINAKSAVLYSENTKTVVFSKNKDERVAPFSTTKLMTAMLVVHHLYKFIYVTIRHCFRKTVGCIVARQNHQSVEELPNRYDLTFFEFH